MLHDTEARGRQFIRSAGVFRLTLIASACVFAFVATSVAPVGLDTQGVVFKAAFAEKGGNGKGQGGGRGGAPGQEEKFADDGSVAEEDSVADSAEGIAGTGASGGSDDLAAETLPLDDSAPASTRVIRELAGLPEDSALSEEEELEAIRSGWGTWRTADGPDTVIAQ